MRRIVLAATGLLLLLSACAQRPTPPVSVTPPPPEAPLSVARLFDDEAEALAVYPDYARREGQRLILSQGGRDIARLTSTPENACEGYETCSLWSFVGVIRIGDTLHGVVRREHGEGDGYVVFASDGHQWMSGRPQVSPDGRYVAAGHLASLVSQGRTEIIDWKASPRQIYESETGCEPETWISAARLKLTCNLNDDDATEPFATEARYDNGQWKFTFLPSTGEPFFIAPQQSPAMQRQITEFETEAGLEIVY